MTVSPDAPLGDAVPTVAPPRTPDPALRRTRKRKRFRKPASQDARATIAHRVHEFYTQDKMELDREKKRRLQRYAKYRQWTSGKSWPWKDSSDAAIPDMVSGALKTQDYLVNAFLSSRPAMSAKARRPDQGEQERKIDQYLDYQLMVEQPGEQALHDSAELFTIEPECVIYVPWIRETRRTIDVRISEPMQIEEVPTERFQEMMTAEFGDSHYAPITQEGWDWEHRDLQSEETDATVHFYTSETTGDVEMLIIRESPLYEGPRVVVKSYEDVFAPAQCRNLQPPGPSNPGGASHVILRDHPSVDEIQRLKDAGWYDLLTDEEMGRITNQSNATQDVEETDQKAAIAGKSEEGKRKDATHEPLTRLLCFDVHDFDGDGKNEDMVYWVLLPEKVLVKAMPLGEMHPSDIPGLRPLAEGSYLPVTGFRSGVSFLELTEGMHDIRKQTVDLMIDGGTIGNFPFGFYRPTSNMKNESIQLWPMELYPLQEPQRDVSFPQLPTRDQAFGFNMLAALQPLEEKATAIGDLQSGRVPAGKSSAFRSAEGVQTLLGQAESRPERILRRFFLMWAQVHFLMHQANKFFLSDEKKFRVAGFLNPGEDPFPTITRSDLTGAYDYEFRANVQNASKQAQSEALSELMGTSINEFTVNMGIVDADGIYRMMRDKARALGVDPDAYYKAPQSDSLKPRIQAEEAMADILDGQIPFGIPAEGAQNHLAKLQEFAQSDELGFLDEPRLQLFQVYVERVAELAKVEAAQQQAAQQAAQGFGGQGGNGQVAAQAPDTGNPRLSGGAELIDESLPSAGGGGTQ